MIGRRSAALVSVFGNEFRMQWRRRAMWFAMTATVLFFVLVFATNNKRTLHASPAEALAIWASFSNLFVPVAFGTMLADRLTRDRRLRVEDLLDSLPASLRARLWGKTLGAAAATAVPFLLLGLGVSVYVAVHLHSLSALPLGVAAFLLINLPALLLAAAICTTLPAIVWSPAARVLFAAAWLWAEFPPFDVPTVSNSLLAPGGGYAAKGIFEPSTVALAPGAHGLLDLGPLVPHVSAASGAIGALLVLALGLTVLAVGPTVVARRRPA